MLWKPILALVGLLAAVLVALGFFYPFGDRKQTFRLPGIVEIQEVRLGSKIGGRVAEVLTAEGLLAKPGQVLVRFEAPETEAQWEQACAHLWEAEADLDKAYTGPRAEEIRQARNDLESAEADRQLTLDEFARIRRLLVQGGSYQAEYDTARAARDRAQGREGMARARLDLFLAGTRPEEITAAEARVAEMEGKLHEIEANLREATVLAPERVLIEVLSVRKGDLVPPNQPILRVLRADDLWVKIYVPETELGRVRLGQEAQVTIDAYPGRRFSGVIMQIASESEFTPRNVQSVDERRHQVFSVKIRVADPGGIFKSGMAAEVVLTEE